MNEHSGLLLIESMYTYTNVYYTMIIESRNRRLPDILAASNIRREYVLSDRAPDWGSQTRALPECCGTRSHRTNTNGSSLCTSQCQCVR